MSKPRRPRRPVDGILLLDKPSGVTSNHILQWVKHRYQAEKAGHTGSLDPLATGLLPICLGEATKLSHFLLDADKAYETTLKLGETTDTSDADGVVQSRRPVPVLTPEAIEAALATFRGPIWQVPSMYSALKHEGKPLYAYARAGETIERPARPVTIHALTLLAQTPDTLRLFVRCSKGTYVRNLVEDLGEHLGCGAHVTALRRVAAGPFHLETAVTPAQIEAAEAQGFAALDALLRPAWSGLADWPSVTLSASSSYYLRHGHPVQVSGLTDAPGYVLFGASDTAATPQFLGIGRRDDNGLLAPWRLVRFDATAE